MGGKTALLERCCGVAMGDKLVWLINEFVIDCIRCKGEALLDVVVVAVAFNCCCC